LKIVTVWIIQQTLCSSHVSKPYNVTIEKVRERKLEITHSHIHINALFDQRENLGKEIIQLRKKSNDEEEEEEEEE
jgi:diadenosine tetraphosphate (Ap4A) HIT family hydrolase